jgi:hypothetical protein
MSVDKKKEYTTKSKFEELEPEPRETDCCERTDAWLKCCGLFISLIMFFGFIIVISYYSGQGTCYGDRTICEYRITEINNKKSEEINNIIDNNNQKINNIIDNKNQKMDKLLSVIFSDTVRIKKNYYQDNNIFRQIQKPQEIQDTIDIVICENSYIEGFYIITNNINNFIFMNHFHSIRIMCFDKKEYIILNNIIYTKKVSFFLNNDLSYWNGYEKKIAEKSEFSCQKNEVPVGILYKKRYNNFNIICKRKDKTEEIKMNTFYLSPIYTNIERNFNEKKERFGCGKNFVSDINFIVKKDTKYIQHIDMVCQQEKNTNDLLFNKVSIIYSDYISSISYFKDNIEFTCNECLNNGSKYEFECPINMNISGYYEWHDSDNLVGIQFICE